MHKNFTCVNDLFSPNVAEKNSLKSIKAESVFLNISLSFLIQMSHTDVDVMYSSVVIKKTQSVKRVNIKRTDRQKGTLFITICISFVSNNFVSGLSILPFNKWLNSFIYFTIVLPVPVSYCSLTGRSTRSECYIQHDDSALATKLNVCLIIALSV